MAEYRLIQPAITPRDGDIFRWSWKPEMKKNSPGGFGDYHCKSRIAIVHEGRLLDTYWMSFGSSYKSPGWADRRTGAHSVSASSVDLSLIANVADLDEIRHGEEIYYSAGDIVDLRHPNNSSAPVYRRKGASRSPGAMLARVNFMIGEAQREIASAESAIARLEAVRARVEEGQTDDEIF